jgi:hypothetical protein
MSQAQFTMLVLAGVAVVWMTWELVKRLIGDTLYIDYFHLANLAGPAFGAAMVARRGTKAGTTPFIWGAYALMLASWFVACALWFDGPFAEPQYLLVYTVCTLAALVVMFMVMRMPAPATAARSDDRAPRLAAAR